MSHRNHRAERKRWSLDHERVEHCLGKRCHLDEVRAQASIDSLRQAGKSREYPGHILHYWSCKRCGFFHVGHTSRPEASGE